MAQFENRIKPLVYVRRITRSTMFIRRNWRMENKFCSMWVQPNKIHYFDYPKCFINRINDDLLLYMLTNQHSCEFCLKNYHSTLYLTQVNEGVFF